MIKSIGLPGKGVEPIGVPKALDAKPLSPLVAAETARAADTAGGIEE